MCVSMRLMQEAEGRNETENEQLLGNWKALVKLNDRLK
jgi:hypothetical protein